MPNLSPGYTCLYSRFPSAPYGDLEDFLQFCSRMQPAMAAPSWAADTGPQFFITFSKHASHLYELVHTIIRLQLKPRLFL